MTNKTSTIDRSDAQRLANHMRGGIAVVKVGPEGVTYHVHKALLVKHSEYFERALNGNWQEAEEGGVTLEDIDCNTFELFVEWMYTQTLPTFLSGWAKDLPSGFFNQHKMVQMAMAKAYVFANRFMAREFGHAVGCALVRWIVNQEAPYYEMIAYAYENMLEGSPNLRALVDSHCKHFSTDADNEKNGEIHHRDKLPRSFLLSVMLRLTKMKEDDFEEDLDLCDYHDHASPAERETCVVAAYEPHNDITETEPAEMY